jgi:hypothetical protein
MCRNPNRGRVYRRCACRDTAGKQLGARCPELANRRHDRWAFALDLPTTDGHRKTMRRCGFPTQAMARGRAALHRILACERAAMHVDDRQTVAEYLAGWLEHKQQTLKPTTMARYADYIRKDLAPPSAPSDSRNSPTTTSPTSAALTRWARRTRPPGQGVGLRASGPIAYSTIRGQRYPYRRFPRARPEGANCGVAGKPFDRRTREHGGAELRDGVPAVPWPRGNRHDDAGPVEGQPDSPADNADSGCASTSTGPGHATSPPRSHDSPHYPPPPVEPSHPDSTSGRSHRQNSRPDNRSRPTTHVTNWKINNQNGRSSTSSMNHQG